MPKKARSQWPALKTILRNLRKQIASSLLPAVPAGMQAWWRNIFLKNYAELRLKLNMLLNSGIAILLFIRETSSLQFHKAVKQLIRSLQLKEQNNKVLLY